MNGDNDREPNGLGANDPETNDSSALNDSELNSSELSDSALTDSELIARLRAADPATDVEPREGFADEVLARTLAGATLESTLDEASAPAPVAELSAERARRRPRWLPLVAVAASLALVGGAGFGIGTATSATTNSADGAAPPITLQAGIGTGANQGSVQNGAVQPGAGQNGFGDVAGAQSKMSGSRVSDMIYPGGFGRNSFSSSGLSSKASTASAYTFDARAASNAATVAALAAALGIEGTAELKDGSWLVGPQDGASPSLSVGLDGTLNFYFSNPLINPWQCDGSVPCEPPATLPSEDAAIEALRSLITSTGRDAGTFEFTSETWEGSFSRIAQAWPVVDGKRIDQSWSLELTDAGVFSASGSLAEIVSLSEYPVVSEQEGFTRLSDPRFGAQMTGVPIALRDQPAAEFEEWVPPTEPPATPTAGTSLSWPVNKVKIVSARLGLTSQWQPDGSVLIVPAYEFTDAEGGTWSVIAVADSKLDFATQ